MSSENNTTQYRRLNPEEAREAARKIHVESPRVLPWRQIGKQVGMPGSTIKEWCETYGWAIERANYHTERTNRYLKKQGVSIDGCAARHILNLKQVLKSMSDVIRHERHNDYPDMDRLKRAMEIGNEVMLSMKIAYRNLSTSEKLLLEKRADQDKDDEPDDVFNEADE
jgi:hypothetical protein